MMGVCILTTLANGIIHRFLKAFLCKACLTVMVLPMEQKKIKQSFYWMRI